MKNYPQNRLRKDIILGNVLALHVLDLVLRLGTIYVPSNGARSKP